MNSDDVITLTQPDDWHLHVRDGEILKTVIAHTARQFARAIIMPNLKPPVTMTADAVAYQQRILDSLPADIAFTPLMTLYLTNQTTSEEIQCAHESGIVKAVKLYPAGATTHSDAGVTDIKKVYPTLQTMASLGMPLLIHGEVTDADVDVFDREKVFIERHLKPLMEAIPDLRVVLEHITTRDAVEFIDNGPDNLAATITPQHLLMNRNAMFEGGIRPHRYCLPVLKREQHRQALISAIQSDNRRYFLGTDSAPHNQSSKESSCGCAGIYSAHAALEFYAQAFENAGALDKLESFASFNGADFYRLPRNTGQIRLRKTHWEIPAHYRIQEGENLIPLGAGESLNWQLVTNQ
jgi:dihydroorotase